MTGKPGEGRVHFVETAYELLLASSEYRRYRRAFEQTMGLTIHLVPAQGVRLEQVAGAHEIPGAAQGEQPFCALMARFSPNCLACLEEERRVISEIGREPVSFACFPGLKRTAVPIWAGDALIGLLQTCPVLPEPPTPSSTLGVSRQALRRGVAREKLPQILRAYEETPVLPPHRDQPTIQLLRLFAEHLATVAERLLPQEENVEPPVIDKAQRIIEAGFARDLPLTKVARAVALSARHFSEVFHKSTGETFSGYLARIRIERAKTLLGYRYLGVGEIAYKVGFRSLSQFNRTFRRLSGSTPSAYREGAMEVEQQK